MSLHTEKIAYAAPSLKMEYVHISEMMICTSPFGSQGSTEGYTIDDEYSELD